MGEADWIEAGSLADVPEGRPAKVSLGGDEVLLYRTAERVLAASNRCTHQAAPLHRGTVRPSGSLVVSTCPLHGSQFDLGTGRVLRGPAVRTLPLYEARVEGDRILVRPVAPA